MGYLDDIIEWGLAGAGAVGGFALGGPGGAAAGFGIGRAIGAPLGDWIAPDPVGLGRNSIGKDLTEQAEAQTQAAQNAINRQLVGALGRTDIQQAQQGTFRSGQRQAIRSDLEQAAMADVSNAAAGISLQAEQLQAQINFQNQQTQLQIAGLEAQRDIANQQAYAQLITALIPSLIENRGSIGDFLGFGGQGGNASEDIIPSSTLTADSALETNKPFQPIF